MVMQVKGLRDRFGETLKEDMTVYKVLIQGFDNPQTMAISPFQNYEYILGQQTSAKLAIAFRTGKVNNGFHSFVNMGDAYREAKRLQREDWKTDWLVRKHGSQYFHSVKAYHDKEVMANLYAKVPHHEFTVYECVVPAGSRIYRGVWHNNRSLNIASDKLTVQHIIDPLNGGKKVEATVANQINNMLVTIAERADSQPNFTELMSKPNYRAMLGPVR